MEIMTLLIVAAVVYIATNEWRNNKESEARYEARTEEISDWEETIEEKGLDREYYEKELKFEVEDGMSIEELEEELNLHKESNKWIEEDKRNQEITESRKTEIIELNEELDIFFKKTLNDLAEPLNVFKEFLDRKEELEFYENTSKAETAFYFETPNKADYHLVVSEKDKVEGWDKVLCIGAEREIFNESKINLIITTYIQDLMEHPENNIFSEETHNNIDDALEKLFNLL